MAAADEYPPAHHVLRDLGFTMHLGGERGRLTLPVTDELRDDQGRVSAGVLACVVDALGGGLAAMAARPGWIATADLTLHLVRSSVGPEIVVDATVLRRGRSTVVLEVELAESGRPLGVATMSFAVLPRRDTNPVVDGEAGEVRVELGGPPVTAPIGALIGLEVIDGADGVVTAPLTDYTRNSLGALQGGVLAMLVDRAATAALGHAFGAVVATVDVHLTYLALGTHGPFRTRTRVLHAAHGVGTAHVEVHDEGRGRRTASARLVAAAGELAP